MMKFNVKLLAIICCLCTSTFLVFFYNVNFAGMSPGEQKTHFVNNTLPGENSGKMHTNTANKTSGAKHREHKISSRTNLIILSAARSGSSFLGALFDSHPHNMYWFEPLWVLDGKTPSSKKKSNELIEYKEKCVNLIDNLFKCDFSNFTDALLSKFSSGFFGGRSKVLCPNLRCRRFSKISLSQACNSHKQTVIKILDSRLPNGTIQNFQDLFLQQNSYDVKVIHLVRDPRAVVYSRVYSVKWINGNYKDPHFRLYVHNICDNIEKNIRIGLLNPLPWLKDRYKIIRYEDLTVNPSNVVQELYRFAGFDWSVNVDKFVSTHNRSPVKGDPFSLYRNASVVIGKWQNAPCNLMKVVEDICGDLMYLLGYKKLFKSD